MNSRLWLLSCLYGFCSTLLLAPTTQAQVSPDGTLNTTVTQSGLNYTITNGTAAGTNLFHSFSQFSIPTGGSVFFNNAVNVQNIFARVTGGSPSKIDGLVRANGTANLFLLNPAGIVFTPNARLNIGGSFVASTANSVNFADGIKFSATETSATPLLTVSVPVGLQMGRNPASITVQGTGNSLSNPERRPLITVAPSDTELRVQPGKTLALVGGNLNLTGATLTAPRGQVELGSVSDAGVVSLIPTARGYTLGYEDGQRFADIQLAQKSLVDVSGVNAGSVQIQGRAIEFSDGSVVLARNFGNLPGGDIHLQASATIDMIGINDAVVRSGVRSDTLGLGASGNITIVTPRLTLQQGAGLNSATVGKATSGNIHIEATDIEVSGFSPQNPRDVSSLGVFTYGSGNAGDLFIGGDRLLVSGGASLASATFGQGSSGKVTIRNKLTTVIGESPLGLYSNISSTTLATGDAKILTLETAKLQILDGGTVAAATFFAGNGGDLSINATESIEISGRSRSNNSSINSSVLHLSPQLKQIFGLPDVLKANAGNVNITTPNLRLTDGGTVSVTSQGSGNGGSLNITANTVQLDRQASIQAQTESGNGGNINLQVGQLLLLRHNSQITATAGGSGDGGNITITAPIIAGFENSDMIANAVKGRGGNIQITTKGIFGLKFRPQLTPENDITASSQFGVSGNVQINTLSIDPTSGVVQLPVDLADPSQQIATGCDAKGSRFVATGRGGLPANPTEQVENDRPWNDIRNVSALQQPGKPLAQSPTPNAQPPIIEATELTRNPNGEIELIALPNTNPSNFSAQVTCVGATTR